MKTFSSKLFHLFDIHYFTRILPTIFVYYTYNFKQAYAKTIQTVNTNITICQVSPRVKY